jgi:hypothetical protein
MMKKLFVVIFLIGALVLSGCSSWESEFDSYVKDLENAFNKSLDAEYIKANFEKTSSNPNEIVYECILDANIGFDAFADKEGYIFSLNLPLDINNPGKSVDTLGYYFAKLAFAISPDMTTEEFNSILDKLTPSMFDETGIAATELNGTEYMLICNEESFEFYIITYTT